MTNQSVGFSPLGAPLTLSATAASVNGTLPGAGGTTCRVVNTSTTLQVAVKVATADQTQPPVASFSDANSVILDPNESRVISIPINATTAAAIGSAAGPTVVYMQRGDGGT